MEAAGVTLAILPLLIAAAENYKQVCQRPFSRYQKFSKEVRKYMVLLDTEQTLYRGLCEALLREVVDKDDTKSMLKGTDHILWSSPSVEASMCRTLGDTKQACINIVVLIGQTLEETDNERQKLLGALKRESRVRVQ